MPRRISPVIITRFGYARSEQAAVPTLNYITQALLEDLKSFYLCASVLICGQNLKGFNLESKKPKIKVPASIYALGLVSLFADISSEMVYPLLPFFLSGVLHAGTIVIGVIEGIADSTATAVNLFSGWFSDRIGKRKGLALLGYAIAALMRPVIGVAQIWQQVFAARFIDRVGKGIRTSPRDALVAQEAPPEIRGKAFGIQRSLDHTGAILGPIIAMGLLFLLGSALVNKAADIPAYNYRLIFILAVIPGLMAVAILWLSVKEKPTPPQTGRTLPSLSFKALRGPFGFYCLVAVIFALGNSSNVFLLLRAQNLGVKVGLVPAAYVLIYIAAAVFSTPAGIISDKLGRRKMLIVGYFFSALVYAGLALAHHPAAVWVLFALYGVYIALTDGMQRAYAADLSPKEILGTTLGTFNALTGLALLPASIIAGALWQHVSPAAPFWFGGITGILAAVLLAAIPVKKAESKI
jgi:MFS family permease